MDTTEKKQRIEGPIKHVLILIAMKAEAQPLIDKLKLQKIDDKDDISEHVEFQGTVKDCKVTLITNGKSSRFECDNVGTNPATLSCYIGIKKFRPDLIINAGTAGGFKKHGACIGDAFVSTKVHNHDRRIPIPGFLEYGKGDHTSAECQQLVKVIELFITQPMHLALLSNIFLSLLMCTCRHIIIN